MYDKIEIQEIKGKYIYFQGFFISSFKSTCLESEILLCIWFRWYGFFFFMFMKHKDSK